MSFVFLPWKISWACHFFSLVTCNAMSRVYCSKYLCVTNPRLVFSQSSVLCCVDLFMFIINLQQPPLLFQGKSNIFMEVYSWLATTMFGELSYSLYAEAKSTHYKVWYDLVCVASSTVFTYSVILVWEF